jgi:hypothetical protein
MLNRRVVQTQRRRRFTDSEDGLLNQLVEQFGTNSWASVAAGIPGRTARQCRSRWKHYVSGSRDVSWTSDEDDMIWEEVAENGPKWTRLGRLLKNRTDIEVKGRWWYLYRKRHNLSFRRACCESGRRNVGVSVRTRARSTELCHGGDFYTVRETELLKSEIEWRTASDSGDVTDEDDEPGTFWNWFGDHP